jgi:hypothetical protein
MHERNKCGVTSSHRWVDDAPWSQVLNLGFQVILWTHHAHKGRKKDDGFTKEGCEALAHLSIQQV